MKKKFTIETISGGISQTYYEQSLDTFSGSLGIDPDLNPSSAIPKTSGVIMPSQYSKFSASYLDDAPMWIVSQPKTVNSYVYSLDGKLNSFDGDIAMRATDEAGTAFPITITGGAGNGAVYYNNFLYLAEDADISQYGGLDQGASIAVTANVWTGAKFGKTALTNTTYPSIRGSEMPNHPMHLHTDNSVYIGDVLPTSGTTSGQGCLHRLKTNRTTIDGDTNDNSAYNVLDLPYGFYPTDIESFGTDLIIAAIQTTSNSINQGRSCLFLWDTVSDTFYKQIWLPDPLVTALKTANGITYVFSGNADSGARISAYLGGEGVQELLFSDEGVSPFAGAVDAYGDRLVFGAFTTYPESSASVMAYGSKSSLIKKAWNNVVRTSSVGTNGLVTSLAYVQQFSGVSPRLVVGWNDNSSQGLDKVQAGTLSSFWRSNPINIGHKFSVLEVRIPLTGTVTTGVTVTPTIRVDDNITSYSLAAINDTNYSGKKEIVYKTPQLTATGKFNLTLDLSFTGTVARGVIFPIEIIVDIHEDSPTL